METCSDFSSDGIVMGRLTRNMPKIPEVTALVYVACQSIFSATRAVVMLARPRPATLPWVSSVRSRTVITATSEVPNSSSCRGIMRRLTMLVSMPVPLMFLPISRTTSTSISGKGKLAIMSLASCNKSASGSRPTWSEVRNSMRAVSS